MATAGTNRDRHEQKRFRDWESIQSTSHTLWKCLYVTQYDKVRKMQIKYHKHILKMN